MPPDVRNRRDADRSSFLCSPAATRKTVLKIVSQVAQGDRQRTCAVRRSLIFSAQLPILQSKF